MEEQNVERYEGAFLNICVSPDVWLNYVRELSVLGHFTVELVSKFGKNSKMTKNI